MTKQFPNVIQLRQDKPETYRNLALTEEKSKAITQDYKHEQEIDRKIAEINAKYSPENKETLELERILYGNGKYWNKKARNEALEHYINSDYTIEDTEKLQKAGKYQEVKQMLEKNKNKYESQLVKKLEDSLELMKKTSDKLKYSEQKAYFEFPIEAKPNKNIEQIANTDYISDEKEKITEAKYKTEERRGKIQKRITPFRVYAPQGFGKLQFNWFEKIAEYIENLGQPVYKPISLYKPITSAQNKGVNEKSTKQMQIKKPIPRNIDYSLSKRREKKKTDLGLFRKAGKIAASIIIGIGAIFNSSTAYAPESNSINKRAEEKPKTQQTYDYEISRKAETSQEIIMPLTHTINLTSTPNINIMSDFSIFKLIDVQSTYEPRYEDQVQLKYILNEMKDN